MIRTANPTLNEEVFRSSHVTPQQGVMTIDGTVNKTIFCLVLAMATGFWAWSNPMTSTGAVQWIALIAAFVIAIVATFKPQYSPVLAPTYAALKGVALGAISWTLSAYISSNPQAVMSGQVAPDSGLVFQAVSLTFLTLFCMLMTYKSGLIKVNDTFRRVVIIGTVTIMFTYLVSLIAGLLGFRMDFLHGSGMFSIGFSLFAIGFAALNLVLDFDRIQSGAQSGSAPKYMEWYGAFALLVTLAWLYIEILHLLFKLQSRD